MALARILMMMAGATPRQSVTRWDPAALSGGGGTLTNGNRTINYGTSGSYQGARGMPARSGRFYFETQFTGGGTFTGVGLTTDAYTFAPGTNTGMVAYKADGRVLYEGAIVAAYSTFGAGDVISLAVDMTVGKIWFAKNGVWQSGDPQAGTGGVSIDPGTYYAHAAIVPGVTTTIPVDFVYTPPFAFQAL